MFTYMKNLLSDIHASLTLNKEEMKIYVSSVGKPFVGPIKPPVSLKSKVLYIVGKYPFRVKMAVTPVFAAAGLYASFYSHTLLLVLAIGYQVFSLYMDYKSTRHNYEMYAPKLSKFYKQYINVPGIYQVVYYTSVACVVGYSYISTAATILLGYAVLLS